MRKATITAVGFMLLSIGFLLGVASNIGFASHLQKITVIKLADIKTDKVQTLMTYWRPNPANLSQKSRSFGEQDAAQYAADLFACPNVVMQAHAFGEGEAVQYAANQFAMQIQRRPNWCWPFCGENMVEQKTERVGWCWPFCEEAAPTLALIKPL